MKMKKRILTVIFAAAFMLLFCGCEKRTAASGVSFLENTVTVERFETYALKLSGTEAKEVTWKSQNENIAAVVDGVVYAKQKGNTKIYAHVDDTDISCDVVVTDNGYVPVIDLKEPEDGVNLVKDQTYALSPVLSYNGNTYMDAEYTYSVIGDAVQVDASGRIIAAELGDAMICVKGAWRECVVETSLSVSVIDVSTSIEVGDKHFEIYLNGDGEEFPSRTDLGITVFDKDLQVEKPDASITYVEKAEDKDVPGAATIKNGVAYASKLGTTHYVAEYKSESGAVVRSAQFSVTVNRTPADIYMTAIRGKDFEFFFEPLGNENSVIWNEEMQAFHLINKSALDGDERGFIINREYLENIIKYTGAESIAFEYKTDGNQTGIVTDDRAIYQSFYPNWYVEGQMQRWNLSGKWTKAEIRFDSIPRDENGNIKTIFLMNTVEGMYIRNIKLYMPGEDRTGYDPNHDYMEQITGKEYEFFIEALSDDNYVKWEESTGSYHLFNRVAEESDTRGFIFNQDYLTNIIRHTNAESIAFEYMSDGSDTGLGTDDRIIYQGFYPNWYVEGQMQRWNLSGKWTKVEIRFDSIPKDEKGDIKTIFLMNTVGGIYIRNIKLYLPGEDRTDYEPEHDYMEDISGKAYEFFIGALSVDNSVKWEESTGAYHLMNTVTASDDTRGFVFDQDYLANIIKHTNAESIVFEYKSDGSTTGLETDDQAIYRGFYPNWYDSATMQRVGLSDEWVRTEIFFDSIPRDANGNLKTVFLMNTVGGMYIRNIKLYLPGEERPKDPEPEGAKIRFQLTANAKNGATGDITLWFMNADAAGALGDAAHKEASVTLGQSTTLEYELEYFLNTSGKYTGFSVGVFTDGEYTITFDRIELVKEDGTTETVSLAEKNLDYKFGYDTGFYGCCLTGGVTYGDGNVTITSEEIYSVHKLITKEEATQGAAIRFQLTANAKNGAAGDITLWFMNADTAGALGDAAHKEAKVTLGQSTTLEYELEYFLNAEGKYEGFSVGVFTNGEYTITFDRIELVKEDGTMETVSLAEKDLDYKFGYDTGFYGCSLTGGVTYGDGNVTITSEEIFSVHKLTIKEEATQSAAIRFQLTANAKNGAAGDITLWFMNADAFGALGDAAHKEVNVALGQLTTFECELEYFLNTEGKYTGFSVGVFTDGEYTITFDGIELVKEDGTTETVSLAEKDLDYKFGYDTGFYGCSLTGGVTYGDGNVTITSETIYSVHKLTTKEEVTQGAAIRFQLTANAKNGAAGDITLWFMNADASGALGDAAHKEAKVTLGQATTLEYELEYFLNAEGNYEGFSVGVFTDGEYTITFDRIELVKEDGTTETVSLAEQDVDYKFGYDTGFYGCSLTGGITYGDGNVTITNGAIYSVHKLTIKEK